MNNHIINNEPGKPKPRDAKKRNGAKSAQRKKRCEERTNGAMSAQRNGAMNAQRNGARAQPIRNA